MKVRNKTLLRGAALALALGGPLIASPPVHAQAGAAPVANQRTFEIAAGPLAEALQAFNRQSGLAVRIDSAQLAGKRSPGVRGTLAPETALAGLLSGSGLRAQTLPGGGFELVASSGEVSLPAITVRSAAERADGPVDGMVARRSATGTKTDTPLIETPQAISVIGEQQMLDQGAETVQEALRYVSGVRSDAYGLDSRGDWVFIRGTEPLMYLDGLRSEFDYYNNTRTDPFSLSRIEVLKGPSSVLYGQGAVGGLLNLVSKRPLDTQQGQIEAQIGTQGWRQVGIDLTGPLTDDGKWLYRLVGVARDADAQVDFVTNDRWLFSPSLTWRPIAGTEWTFLANVQRDTSGQTSNFLPWSGTVLPNPNGRIPTSRLVSEPTYDQYDTDQASFAWFFSSALNETWTVVQNLRYRSSSATYRALYPDVYSNPSDPFVDPEKTSVYRYIYAADRDAKSLVTDTRAQARFATGPVEHLAIAGVDYSQAKVSGQTGYGFNDIAFNLFAPVYGNYTAPDLFTDPELKLTQLGLYLQDQMKIDQRWVGVLGVRYDKADTDIEGSPTIKDTATTWRAALLYLFDNGLAPYASYSESFLPVGFTDFYNQPYKPQRGKQYEVGIKYQPSQGNLLATASLYKIEDQNRLSPDPVNPFNQIQLGVANIKGVELELNAQFTPQFNVIASYTYTDAEQTDDDTGATYAIAGVPKNMASIWGMYRFAVADIPGFSVGAGVRYLGNTTDETGTLEVPGTTLVDLMFAWEQAHWRFAVNAQNVGDKIYESTCLSRGDCFYGSRRTVMATLGYRF